jgi:hypothetical protein
MSMRFLPVSVKLLLTAALLSTLLSFDVREGVAAQISDFVLEVTPPGGNIDQAGFFGLLIDHGTLVRYDVATGRTVLATGDEPVFAPGEVPGRIFSDSFQIQIQTQNRDGFYNPLFCFDLDPTESPKGLVARDINDHLIIGGIPRMEGSSFFLDVPLAFKPVLKQIRFSAPSSGACFYRAYDLETDGTGDFGLFGVPPTPDGLSISYEVPASVVAGGMLSYQRVITNTSDEDLDVFFQETFPANPAVFTSASFASDEVEVRDRVTIPAGQSFSSELVSRALPSDSAVPGQSLHMYFGVAALKSNGAIVAASEHRRVLITAADAGRSEVSVTPNEPLEANGKDSATITVTVRDSELAPVGGQTITLAVTAGDVGNGGLQNSSVVSAVNGQASTQLVSTRSGMVNVTAYLGSTSADPVIGSVTVEFVAGSAFGLAFFSEETELTAGTGRLLEIEVVDQFGNRVPDDSGRVITLLQSDGEGSVLGLANATTAAGVATRQITGDRAGLVTVSAAAVDLSGASTGFQVIPGEVTHLVFINVPEQLASAGQANMTVELRDQQGNRVTADSGTPVQFVQDGGDGSVAGLGSVPSADGRATITLSGFRAGSVDIKASSGGLSPVTTSFVVVAGAPYALEFTSVPPTIAVDETRNLRIELQDINGNRILGGSPRTIQVTPSFVSNQGAVFLPNNGQLGMIDGEVDFPVTGTEPGNVKLLAVSVIGSAVEGAKATLTVTSALSP